MDDTSVHYDSTKSLVTIGDGMGGGATSATIVKDKSPNHQNLLERDPTVNEILQNAGVKLERALDHGYYL